MADEVQMPGRDAVVTLREVTGENFDAVCRLSATLKPPQSKAVALNAYSLAQAFFEPKGVAWSRAIYADETPVGFLMLERRPWSGEYFLWRLMVAAPHQGKGFARRAVEQVIEYVKTLPNARTLETSCVEGEGSPLGFYERMGFRPTGDREGQETVLRMDLAEGDPGYVPNERMCAEDLYAVRVEEIIRTYFDRLLNQRDLSVCDEVLAADYVDDDGPADAAPGPDVSKAWVAGFLERHDEMRIEVEEVLVDGLRAAVRLTWRGREAVTGKAFERSGLAMIELNEEGQFVRRATYFRD